MYKVAKWLGLQLPPVLTMNIPGLNKFETSRLMKIKYQSYFICHTKMHTFETNWVISGRVGGVPFTLKLLFGTPGKWGGDQRS